MPSTQVHWAPSYLQESYVNNAISIHGDFKSFADILSSIVGEQFQDMMAALVVCQCLALFEGIMCFILRSDEKDPKVSGLFV